MGSIVRSTGYKVLHRPVEPAGVLGMWPKRHEAKKQVSEEEGLSGIGEETYSHRQTFSVLRHDSCERFVRSVVQLWRQSDRPAMKE
jgi:hypothetical protein